MSVSAYGHCRPGVKDYDSWEKHTTHLSSAQVQLTIKAAERLQTGTDGPSCTSHPHLLCHGDGPEVSPYRGTALPRQATSDQPDPPAVSQKPPGKPRAKHFPVVP